MWNAVSGGTQLQSIALETSGTPAVPTNRMTSVTSGGVTLTQSYDAAGNLTNDGVHAYEYDAENRLVTVDKGPNGALASYGYDAHNWRLKKATGGVTTLYVWEGAAVIAEYSTASGQGSGGTRYYHADRLSTRLMTDANGGVMGTNDHLPFGEDAGTTGETEKHRFTSYERDAEVGTDYAVNRQHSAGTGRFTQADPNSGTILYPGSLNRYSYVGGDATNRVDSTGLKSENIWSLYRGLSLPGVTNIMLDGIPLQQYQLSYFAHLWISGGAETPWGAYLRTLPEWYKKEYHLQDPNDLWQLLPLNFSPVAFKTRQDVINDAVFIAGKALDLSVDCRELLANPLTTSAPDLRKWLGEISEAGKIHEGDVGGAGAATFSGNPYPEIRIGTRFFSSVQAVFGEGSKFPYLDLAVRQVLTILHELGHATKAPTHGLKNAESEAQYNQLIYDACLKGREKQLGLPVPKK